MLWVKKKRSTQENLLFAVVVMMGEEEEEEGPAGQLYKEKPQYTAVFNSLTQSAHPF